MFKDRRDAGMQLAAELTRFEADDPVVVGLPRGGVPVAVHVADRLHAPLDVVVVRKLGAPLNPEFAFGAVGEGGAVVVDENLRHELAVSDRELHAMIAEARALIDERSALLRWQRTWTPVEGRTVIVVDDGLATGATARAAVQVLRERSPRSIVVAVPTGSPEAVRRLREVADEVVCLETPRFFGSVSAQYDDFTQVSDDQVVAALRAHAVRAPQHDVSIPIGDRQELDGVLGVPSGAKGLVIFAHGSGSSRLSPRNIEVAAHLQREGIATLLMDLLTEQESELRSNVFDVSLLSSRLRCARDWAMRQAALESLPMGYFGASTGAAAALVAAASDPQIAAVVSRGGRPDLAASALDRVQAPTLLIVGDDDHVVLELNEQAAQRLRCETRLAVVDGATHLFEEPGAMMQVERLASEWYLEHFAGAVRPTVAAWQLAQHQSL